MVFARFAVSVKQAQKEVSNYRTLRQYRDEFAAAVAAPNVSEGSLS